MESIDDPLTDIQNPSANTDLQPPTTTAATSQQLHLNPGATKAGSNTRSYRAPRASCRQQGLITQPQTGEPGRGCFQPQAHPRTPDNTLLALKHCLFPATGSSGLVTCSLLLSVVGSKCCVRLLSSPL